MRDILELTLVRDDPGFLKYIISNHSVDINGELLPRITCNVTPLCACECTETCTLAGGLLVSYQFAAPVAKQGESPLAVAVRERNLGVIKYLVKECIENVYGVSSINFDSDNFLACVLVLVYVCVCVCVCVEVSA